MKIGIPKENKVEQVLTTETKLKDKEIISYMDDFRKDYNSALRYFWNTYRNNPDVNISNENTKLQKKFEFSKRVCNSIIQSVKGMYESQKELFKFQLNVLALKIESLSKKYDKLRNRVNSAKEKTKLNRLNNNQLKIYRSNKKKLYFQGQKIQKLKAEYFRLENRIKNNTYKICFGSKKLFKAQFHLEENGYKSHEQWLKNFRNKRDSNIVYIGSKGETKSNSMFQLNLEEILDNCSTYSMKIRKNTKEKEYLYGICKLKYLDKELNKYLLDNSIHGVTYRIHFRNKKCYLQIMLTLIKDDRFLDTCTKDGTIGIDFNKGFLETGETDSKGNLIKLRHFDRKYYSQGNKSESELQKIIVDIIKLAKESGKSIIIEDLNFSKKKGKATKAKSDKGKEYNNMLHTLDYSRYTKLLERACFRNDVELIKVNPFYTSQVAKWKYCKKRKMTVHEGASWMIARKGQNYKWFMKDMDEYLAYKNK